VDAIRQRFGRNAIGYAAAALDHRRSVPDAFRELAEKDLGSLVSPDAKSSPRGKRVDIDGSAIAR
jgi:hypothetical protein